MQKQIIANSSYIARRKLYRKTVRRNTIIALLLIPGYMLTSLALAALAHAFFPASV